MLRLSSLVRTSLFTWFTVALGMPLHAQVDGALVVRRGAEIRGTVDGALVALDGEAEVTIGRGAVVSGALVLHATCVNR
jgi:hypothetical protein